MKKVLVNEDFKDVYTGEIHKAGEVIEITAERIVEIKSVNPNFVSVIGEAEAVKAEAEAELEKAKAEAEAAKAELEKAKAELAKAKSK